MIVKKAREIRNAKIEFISLVDRAANKKQFLITKSAGDTADFLLSGKIIKADEKTHHITGIVYEPMTEDAHGDFMTEDEILKAAYWFAKNGDKVDRQHNFESITGASVVENWVTKADTEIAGQPIKKGTWLITVEVDDTGVWEAVCKGEVTGFSMGGVGEYSREETDLSKSTENDSNREKAGVFKKLAGLLGFEVVEKGEVTERFEESAKHDNFWAAFYALKNTLFKYDWRFESQEIESDETAIREALEEFSEIIVAVLAAPKVTTVLAETAPLEKAGRKMSGKNYGALKKISADLNDFLAGFGDTDEKADSGEGVTITEIEKAVDAAVEKIFNKAIKKEDEELTKEEVQKIVDAAIKDALAKLKDDKKEAPVTEDKVEKMVNDAIKKALEPKDDLLTAEAVQTMVTDAVAKAVEPILKSRGLTGNLNAERQIEKTENRHYLAGLL